MWFQFSAVWSGKMDEAILFSRVQSSFLRLLSRTATGPGKSSLFIRLCDTGGMTPDFEMGTNLV